jgi:hypothetical protein
MRRKYSQKLMTLVIGFALVLALVAGPILNETPSSRLKIVFIAALGLAMLVLMFVNAARRISDRAKGRSPDDEFTEVARLNAGHAAFMMSMVLWLLIFAAQGSFDSTRTMLGSGILGQCGLYGICLAYFKRSGSLHED